MTNVDYLINVLPATRQTDLLLSRNVIEKCNNVGFVNIGRGNVIKEDDIIYALDNGMFSKVTLDVFQNEPLVESSALWSHKNVTSKYPQVKNILKCFFSIVTPHVAGESRPQDIAECFKNNFERVQAGLEPDNLLDWSKLY